MSNRSRRDAAARTEARRRARLQARGIPVEEQDPGREGQPDAARQPAPPGGLLGRLFPPAPPLAGMPDPLKGFHYTGPLRGVVSSLYLLARNPLTWIVGGVLWAIGELFTANRGDALIGILSSLVSFGALIGAGWFGWQRPWLFGLAAAVLGWLLFIGAVLALGGTQPVLPPDASGSPGASAVASRAATPTSSPAATASPSSPAGSSPGGSPDAGPGAGPGQEQGVDAGLLVQAIAFRTLFQALLGTLAGWYGGYLRRRMASVQSPSQRTRTRRR
ncbi:MAG TPA: hypothetical protein VFH63_07525 [candidate division Zixibacteria bacterium]|nr:hypothetical protein [candidate division Zixibacteria bacterium]